MLKETTVLIQQPFLNQNIVPAAFKDQLLEETTFITSLEWSLNTRYTVYGLTNKKARYF